jgi:hypothetical protein
MQEWGAGGGLTVQMPGKAAPPAFVACIPSEEWLHKYANGIAVTRGPAKGHGGRPSTPTELKRKRGTDRPDRTPAKGTLAPVPAMDAAPIELTLEQAIERSCKAGAAWLSESDTLAVVVLRESIEVYLGVKADPKSKPTEVLAALQQVGRAGADCGFTPGERARLGLAEVTARSKMEELRARKVENEGPVGGAASG